MQVQVQCKMSRASEKQTQRERKEIAGRAQGCSIVACVRMPTQASHVLLQQVGGARWDVEAERPGGGRGCQEGLYPRTMPR